MSILSIKCKKTKGFFGFIILLQLKVTNSLHKCVFLNDHLLPI